MKKLVLLVVIMGLMTGAGCKGKSQQDASSDQAAATKSDTTNPVKIETAKSVSNSVDSAAGIDPAKIAEKQVTYSAENPDFPIRNKDNKFVTLETDMGKMVLELYHDVAPAHADSFLSLTKKKFYNGTIFHRVIDGFMIQGGDPTGTGMGGPGYQLNAEFSDLRHMEGTLSAARGPDVNSAGSQFFICLAPQPGLDHQYTVFGQLVNGKKVLHEIGSAPMTKGPGGDRMPSKPVNPVHIRKAYQSDAAGNAI